MKERDLAEGIIERLKNGDWEEFAKFGYIRLGNEQHGQYLYPQLKQKPEDDEPVDIAKLLEEVCLRASEVDKEDPKKLAEQHKEYANSFLLPDQPEGSATDAQVMTHLFTHYSLSMVNCPIGVSALNY